MRRSLASLVLRVVAFAVSGACAPTPAPAPPTVGSAATAVITATQPATAVAASPVATQVVAAASPAVAAASPVASAVAAASPIRITGVQFGANTTIAVQNTTSSPVDLTGWKLRVGSASVTLPGEPRISPNETLTLHTASGTSAGRDLYLGRVATPLFHDLLPGVSIALLDASNNVMAEFTLPR